MDWLEAQELAAMRQDMETFLSATCTIEYVTTGVDAEGAPYRAWTTRQRTGVGGTAIPCRLVRLAQTRQLDVVSGRVTEPTRRELWVAYDQDCAVTDRVTIAGDVWEVREADGNETDRLLRRIVLTKEN